VIEEAQARGIELVVLPTANAVEELERSASDTNAVLHLTC
jgi:hypothetical protein